MSFKSRLGIILLIIGIVTVPFTRFGDQFLLLSLILVTFGSINIIREVGGAEKIGRLLRSSRRQYTQDSRGSSPRIDPLLPVRVLKLAESHAGSLTVSVVAMALNVGLDECQIALDELVRKGAANVDVDLSNGVANYRFPEFLPSAVEGAGPL
jgi:hypothetical protein